MENPFLKTFGRPARELACECERESDSNLSQALQLIGGATVNGKLRDDNGRMAALAKSDEVARGDHPGALPGRPGPRAQRHRAGRRRQAPDRRHRPPPGRRGPGLGPDQLQGVPVPALIGARGRRPTRSSTHPRTAEVHDLGRFVDRVSRPIRTSGDTDEAPTTRRRLIIPIYIGSPPRVRIHPSPCCRARSFSTRSFRASRTRPCRCGKWASLREEHASTQRNRMGRSAGQARRQS